MDRADITPDIIRTLLDYDPNTGKLYWKRRPGKRTFNTRYAGTEALAFVDVCGHKKGRIHDIGFQAHRVVWAHVHGAWPTEQIDHINGDPADNRIDNLRDVPHILNHYNTKRHRSNTSGHQGVAWNKRVGKWMAYVGGAKQRQYLGHYANKDDAIAARVAAESKLGYHANHGRTAPG